MRNMRRAVGIFCAAVALFPARSTFAASAPPAPAPALTCGKGQWFDAHDPAPECVTCAVKTMCPKDRDLDSDCRRGHTGNACIECEENYFMDKNYRCQECPSQGIMMFAWFAVAAGCVIAGVGIYHYAAADLTPLTIAVTHFQLIYVYASFKFKFPSLVAKLYAPLQVFSGFGYLLNFLGGWADPSCMGQSQMPFSVWWTLQMLSPYLFMLPFVAIFMSSSARQRKDQLADAAKAPEHRILSLAEYDSRKGARFRSKSAAQAILFICISSIMNGVSASAHVWYCGTFDDGSMRMSGDLSVICSQSNAEYQTLKVVAAFIFVLYYFGTSGMLLYIVDSAEGRRSSAEHCVTHAR